MTGVVDVGGGLRGVYGAGVFDCCLEQGITFDYYIGVSAGSANIAAFLAGQRGRNFLFYSEYSFRKKYMGIGNYIRTGSYLDLEYIYGDALTNSGGEYPLDYDVLERVDKPVKIVATDAVTGRPVYFDLHDMKRNDYGAIKASSCVPVVNRPYFWNEKPYYDGGISDPIPFERALEAGCDKVVIILTRPKNYERADSKDYRMACLMRKYPNASEAMKSRAKLYNRQLLMAKECELSGKTLIIAPDNIGKMSTLTKDKKEILAMYEMGKRDAEQIHAYVKK